MFCCCPDEVDSDDNNTFQDKKPNDNPTDNGKVREESIKEVPSEVKEANPQTEEIQEGNSILDSVRPSEGKLDSPGPQEDAIESINHEISTEENIMSTEALSSAVHRLEAVATRLEALAGRSGGPARSLSVTEAARLGGPRHDVLAPSVVAYDAEINEPLGKFTELSNQIDGDVKTMAGLVQKAFSAARDILIIASKSKKPDDDLLGKLLKPLSEAINEVQFRQFDILEVQFFFEQFKGEITSHVGDPAKEVYVGYTVGNAVIPSGFVAHGIKNIYLLEPQNTQFRENNRPSSQFNHLSAVSEAIPAMGWVSVAPTPGPYVKEMQDAGMFYTNRILKDFKEKDQRHVDWVKAWMSIFRILQAYIKEHHTTGLSWNPQGGVAAPVTAAKPSAGGAPAPPPPGPPPPPPPPVAPPADVAPTASGDDSSDRSALFAELNKGMDITKGLKKVTDDMKTHKNPTLRQGPAPFKAAGITSTPKPFSKPAPAKVEQKQKPPVFELQMKKWVIEHQVGNKNMVIDNTELKQVVYMFKCTDSALVVKGKVNSIILDSCKKVGVAFDDVVSSIEFINCQSVQGQVMGKVPTVSIDKTDGCQMFLSKDSLDVEIVTAKSSEMNMLIPTDDGDYVEFPIPEQFKTTYNGKKFTTTATESV